MTCRIAALFGLNARTLVAPSLLLLSGACDAGLVASPRRLGVSEVGVDATTAGSNQDAAVPSEASLDATQDSAPADQGGADASSSPVDAAEAGSRGTFCSLPGSVVWDTSGPTVVPGAVPSVVPGTDASAPDLTWLKLPPGFCAHYYGWVPTARQLRFAPGGELFAASPSSGTTGGKGDGISGVLVLPDDDHDGNADSNITFVDGIPSVQGLMFANGYFYYQDATTIRRVPYAPGDRSPSGPSEVVTSMANWMQAGEHWPKVFDQARDGTIYITNGSTQGEMCLSTRPVFGAIVALNADGTTSEVAKGFRNPIALRCESNHDVCLAAELALDYSADMAGREKIVPVRQGDDWGFPCCATQGTPYAGVVYQGTNVTPDCSGVALESDSFVIGHTPFGLDFETGRWPAPWGGRVFLTLHGDAGSWGGARVVAIALDANGLPLPATELVDADSPDNMREFATGWDDQRQDHGRPAPVAFAPDGRLFLGDDQRGAVIWIAPVGLMQ